MARAKEPLEIGVLNVRTLKAEYKQSELTYVSGKIRIDILRTYYEQTNSNGQPLVDLAIETNMVITNTQFQK